MACRLYILTVLIETAIDLTIEAELLVRVHSENITSDDEDEISSRKMPVYLSIFALAQYASSSIDTYTLSLKDAAACFSLSWRSTLCMLEILSNFYV